MIRGRSELPTKLFYSYSHKDSEFKGDMETSLDLLKRNGLLEDWSDSRILPGRPISSAIRAKMDESDILVFLFSPEFIASDECMKEWDYAKELATRGKLLFRIPIVVRECAWLDVLRESGDEEDSVKALPDDGKPVTGYEDRDVAWKQVYEGIKSVVSELRSTFTPKQEFIESIEETEFTAESNIKLQDIFVFSGLTPEDPKSQTDILREETVSTVENLLDYKRVLIHGHENSGKTALARYLYISLIEQSQPVLFMDLAQPGIRVNESSLRNAYFAQFNGDYSLWGVQPNKTLILDNLTDSPRALEFIAFAQDFFDRVIVTTSSDHFFAYFVDESRLSTFRKMRIEPLSRSQQLLLIKRRLELLADGEPVTDGFVDRVEADVNSVIISARIVPRYPFYVLSIVQAQEKFMPNDSMPITSYGHCYYMLILARLLRAGIDHSDIDASFNFSEQLAYALYRHISNGEATSFDFEEFLSDYRRRFIIRDSIINRLKHPFRGIIVDEGMFRYRFMYYFFLGRFLARGGKKENRIIQAMCEDSHLESNYLALLFTIHHTNDIAIIDDILIRTMCTLDYVDPASLRPEDTGRFADIINELPEEILSPNSVEAERARVRDTQDAIDEIANDVDETANETTEVHEVTTDADSELPRDAVYKILKNNKIMGQILRNKYGSLERATIEEVVEIISDSGLRLVNAVLIDEKELTEMALLIKEEHPDIDLPEIKRMLELLSFFWTMVHIQEVVNAVNVPEIRSAVNAVVRRSATPAYDLIGYFSQLDRADKLDDLEYDRLEELLKAHRDDAFIQRVLSLKTQQYMNTHRSKATIEQKVCSLLNIRYIHRPHLTR